MNADRSVHADSNRDEIVGPTNYLVALMFLFVFLGFGLILLGDLLSALWQ